MVLPERKVFDYSNFKPIEEFSQLQTEDQLAALIALMISLESVRPGTIAYVLTKLSLIDGGFRLKSAVSDESAVSAMQCQRDFLEEINKLVQSLSF
jgi:hypothetical protein